MNKYTLENSIKNLPRQPGCYLFKNATGQILYIGKAKNLKNRVRSYFTDQAQLSPAKEQMVAAINQIDYITVRTEAEALLLESNLIKKHQPRYNIVLRDDKFFQYLKIVNEPQPRIITTRRLIPDGSEYYGPYSSGTNLKQTLRILRKIFPFRTANKNDFVYDVLQAGEKVSTHQYHHRLGNIKKILRGKNNQVKKILEKKMKRASQDKNYEQAAFYRDGLKNLEKINSIQQVIMTKPSNADIINWIEYDHTIFLALLKIRQGRVSDKLTAYLTNPLQTETELIHSFIKQYYLNLSDQPKILVLPIEFKLETSEANNIFQNKIKIKTPLRGKYKKLLELTKLNAAEYAKQNQPTFLAAHNITGALKNLKKELKLTKIPQRIEGYDISNIQGKYAVGAMVVFQNGQPAKAHYRKFKIKYSTGQPNDFAMLAEIIARRLRHDDWPSPDLLVVDGGKGQLTAAQQTLKNQAVNWPLLALAKKQEEVFVPGEKNRLKIFRNSPEYFLLQRIRDEAHRFAIGFYRQQHRQTYRL